jgi:hypothetical protein
LNLAVRTREAVFDQVRGVQLREKLHVKVPPLAKVKVFEVIGRKEGRDE